MARNDKLHDRAAGQRWGVLLTSLKAAADALRQANGYRDLVVGDPIHADVELARVIDKVESLFQASYKRYSDWHKS